MAMKQKMAMKQQKAKSAGRASIYKGTDQGAKAARGTVDTMKNQPGVYRGVARAKVAAAAKIAAVKGKGLRGTVKVNQLNTADEKAFPGTDFRGSTKFLGGAEIVSTLKKAPKGRVSK